MGLFDSLKKMTEDLGKEIEKGVNSEGFKDFKNAMESAAKEATESIRSATGSNSSARSAKEIPAEYAEFPRFREVVTDVSTKETDKYIRCTMNFQDATEQEISDYISKITSAGYVKGSNVRYDKGNTYIIVEENYGLNIVFHIKR